MAKQITSYKIEDFPADDRIWQLSWFKTADVNFSVPLEPTIDVILTPLKSKIINESVELNSFCADFGYCVVTL